jgi:hypothetical protein
MFHVEIDYEPLRFNLTNMTLPENADLSQAKSKPIRDSPLVLILLPIVAAIIGGLAGSGVTIYFQRRQSKNESRSLILAFAVELVLAFERCVAYYEQSKTEKIMYSALFDFSDAALVSKFAAVSDDSEVVASIMSLKSIYFQVRRHIEDASKFAAQADRIAVTPEEKERLKKAADHAQRTALAFFLGPEKYEVIERETAKLINAAQRTAPGRVIDEYSQKFSGAQQKKKELDKNNKGA